MAEFYSGVNWIYFPLEKQNLLWIIGPMGRIDNYLFNLNYSLNPIQNMFEKNDFYDVMTVALTLVFTYLAFGRNLKSFAFGLELATIPTLTYMTYVYYYASGYWNLYVSMFQKDHNFLIGFTNYDLTLSCVFILVSCISFQIWSVFKR